MKRNPSLSHMREQLNPEKAKALRRKTSNTNLAFLDDLGTKRSEAPKPHKDYNEEFISPINEFLSPKNAFSKPLDDSVPSPRGANLVRRSSTLQNLIAGMVNLRKPVPAELDTSEAIEEVDTPVSPSPSEFPKPDGPGSAHSSRGGDQDSAGPGSPKTPFVQMLKPEQLEFSSLVSEDHARATSARRDSVSSFLNSTVSPRVFTPGRIPLPSPGRNQPQAAVPTGLKPVTKLSKAASMISLLRGSVKAGAIRAARDVDNNTDTPGADKPVAKKPPPEPTAEERAEKIYNKVVWHLFQLMDSLNRAVKMGKQPLQNQMPPLENAYYGAMRLRDLILTAHRSLTPLAISTTAIRDPENVTQTAHLLESACFTLKCDGQALLDTATRELLVRLPNVENPAFLANFVNVELIAQEFVKKMSAALAVNGPPPQPKAPAQDTRAKTPTDQSSTHRGLSIAVDHESPSPYASPKRQGSGSFGRQGSLRSLSRQGSGVGSFSRQGSGNLSPGPASPLLSRQGSPGPLRQGSNRSLSSPSTPTRASPPQHRASRPNAGLLDVVFANSQANSPMAATPGGSVRQLNWTPRGSHTPSSPRTPAHAAFGTPRNAESGAVALSFRATSPNPKNHQPEGADFASLTQLAPRSAPLQQHALTSLGRLASAGTPTSHQQQQQQEQQRELTSTDQHPDSGPLLLQLQSQQLQLQQRQQQQQEQQGPLEVAITPSRNSAALSMSHEAAMGTTTPSKIKLVASGSPGSTLASFNQWQVGPRPSSGLRKGQVQEVQNLFSVRTGSTLWGGRDDIVNDTQKTRSDGGVSKRPDMSRSRFPSPLSAHLYGSGGHSNSMLGSPSPTNHTNVRRVFCQSPVAAGSDSPVEGWELEGKGVVVTRLSRAFLEEPRPTRHLWTLRDKLNQKWHKLGTDPSPSPPRMRAQTALGLSRAHAYDLSEHYRLRASSPEARGQRNLGGAWATGGGKHPGTKCPLATTKVNLSHDKDAPPAKRLTANAGYRQRYRRVSTPLLFHPH